MKNKNQNRKKEKVEITEDEIQKVLNDIKSKDEFLNIPRTLLKKEEWGLLTILNLLLAGIFPAYFVNILLISFFTELGHLWTTHLSEKGRRTLIDFEKEFRVGYEKEKVGDFKGAIILYEKLVSKYKDNPKVAKIAINRIDWIEKNKIKKDRK